MPTCQGQVSGQKAQGSGAVLSQKAAAKKPASKTKTNKSPCKPKAKMPKVKPAKAKSPAKKLNVVEPKKFPVKKPAAEKATKKLA